MHGDTDMRMSREGFLKGRGSQPRLLRQENTVKRVQRPVIAEEAEKLESACHLHFSRKRKERMLVILRKQARWNENLFRVLRKKI